MIKAIIDSCIMLSKKELPEADVFLLKRRLTLIPKDSGFGEMPEPIHLYQETKDFFFIPRYSVHRFAGHLPIEYEDRTSIGFEINLKSKIKLRDHQVGIMDQLENHFRKMGTGGVLQAGTGLGKSLCRASKVIMFDGSVKNVEEVRVGDLLMGMDSTPRRVLALGSGYSKCYKIIPTKGDSWRCNEDHILTLRCTSDKGVYKKTYERGRIIDIPLKEYLGKNKKFKHYYKQFRVGVEFSEQDRECDSYFMGLWLGDGSRHNAEITNGDIEIKDYLLSLKGDNRIIRISQGSNCERFHFSKNSKVWKSIGGTKHKFIPKNFLINTRENRMLLLAGLLDTDGCLCSDDVTYEICTKYETLKDDILFLARSLGFAAYSSKRIKKIKSMGFSGEYNIITISGNTSEIPCLVERKKAKKRMQIKDVLNVGFKVEEDGYDEYFGFVLDGDHRYLIHDFTVTHNTIIAIELARRLKRTTLIKVYKDDLADQWAERINQSVVGAKIGRIQGDVCDYEGKDFVIAMIQTLVSRHDVFASDDKIRNYFGLEIVDELHRTGSKEWSKTASIFNSKYRLGLSVDGGSMLFLKKDGFIFRMTIGDLTDKYIGNVEKTTFLNIEHENIYVRSFNKGQFFEWKRIKSVIKHPISKEKCYTLSCCHNTSIGITESHSIFCVDKNKVISIAKGGQINVDDRIVFECEKVAGYNIIGMVDVCRYINVKGNNFKFHSQLLSVDKYAKSSKEKFRYREGKLGKYIPLERLYEEDSFDGVVYYEGSRYSSSRYIHIDSICYLVGFFIGNGWISEGYIGLSVSKKRDVNFLKGIKEIERYFVCGIAKKDKGGSFEYRISNRILQEIFSFYFNGMEATTKRMHDDFFNISSEGKKKIICGLIDSDGHIPKNEKMVYYSTSSVNLKNDILDFLRTMGVRASFHKRAPCRGGIIDGRQIVGKKNNYIIYFSMLFAKGKLYEKKMNPFVNKGYDARKVECVKEYAPKYMYDLSVEDNENFVANGFLVHNSATPDRKDRCEDAFFLHVGPIVVKHDQTDLIADIYFKETNYVPVKPEMDNWLPTTQLGILSKNYGRNVLIAGDIVKALSAGRKIIVLSKFVDHLHSIEKIVSHLIRLNNLSKTTGFYTGSVNASIEDKEKKIRELEQKASDLAKAGKIAEYNKALDKLSKIKSGKIKVREHQGKEDLKEAARADVLFATLKKAEDSLDIASLDTLFYAMPISDPRQSCFIEDSPVWVGGTVVKIQDVKVGQDVLIDGSHQIYDTMKRYYVGDVLFIHPKMTGGFTLTPEHPVLICARKFSGGKPRKVLWVDFVEAAKVRDFFYEYSLRKKERKYFSGTVYYTGVKIIRDEISDEVINSDLARLVGYFLAEGSISWLISKERRANVGNRGGRAGARVSFAFHTKEQEYRDDIKKIVSDNFGITGFEYSHEKNKNSTSLNFTSLKLADFLFEYVEGTMANNKTLKEKAVLMKTSYQEQLLEGYFRGDGSYYKKCGNFVGVKRYHSSSYNLCVQVQMILYRLNIFSSVQTYRCKSENRFSKNPMYEVSHVIDRVHCDGFFYDVEKDVVWFQIKNIESRQYSGYVYNFSVENIERYMCCGGIVHNCGRILRQFEGKKQPLVVDYTDDALSFCLNLKRSRERFYISKGFRLVRPNK